MSDRVAEQRPTLLVLGTAHFANPGRDEINIQVEDVLSDARQAEIESLVDQLRRFSPTHIAVEMDVADQAQLDRRYREYREGAYTLGRSEIDQIALRLGKALAVERIDAVDWNGQPTGELSAYDWPSWAEANDRYAELSAIRNPERFMPILNLGQEHISTWLARMNSPEALAIAHRIYFDVAMIGDDTSQPGANWVGHWYARNLRIFRKLAEIATHPDDRILVIFGQGHAYLLRQFARESGAFRLVDVGDVLE